MVESDKYRAKKCSDFKLFSWSDFLIIFGDTISFYAFTALLDHAYSGGLYD